MNTWSYFSFLLLLPVHGSGELESPPSQGHCPEGWLDGSSVGQGCLYFNLSEPIHWLESVQSCQLGHENATAVEIISPEVNNYLR